MTKYNLKDDSNKWTNIAISIDNDNNSVELFVNGKKQRLQPGNNTSIIDNMLSIDAGIRLTKNVSSKITLGGKKNGTKKFTGKLERFEITNKTKTTASARATYNALKSRKLDSMFDIKFNNNSITDSSKYKVSQIKKEIDGFDVVRHDDRNAVKFNGGFVEMTPTESMVGEKLKNTTFSTWVKIPITSNNAGYMPILSRNGIFSFGLNNGHVSLFLGKNNQLVPGTNITNEFTTTTTIGSSIDSTIKSDNEDLVFDANFNTNDTNVTTTSTTKKYSEIIPGSKYIELSKSDTIQLDKSKLVGKDLSSFTFSGWVNFSSLNDNGVIFERPDTGLKLFTDATGKISLNYKTI